MVSYDYEARLSMPSRTVKRSKLDLSPPLRSFERARSAKGRRRRRPTAARSSDLIPGSGTGVRKLIRQREQSRGRGWAEDKGETRWPRWS